MPAKRTKEEAAAYMKRWRAEQKQLRMAHRATTPSSVDGPVRSVLQPAVPPAKTHLACDETIHDLRAEVAGQQAIILALQARIADLEAAGPAEALFGD